MSLDWRAKELTTEVVVGVFVVMVFLALGVFTIILSEQTWFRRQYELEVMFQNVMGLREGDNAVVRGMPVGTVNKLDLVPEGVRVQVLLDKPIELRRDHRITIVATSILGGRMLSIEQGSENEPVVSPDLLFRGVEPYDLMADAAEMVNAVKSSLTEGGVLHNLQDATAAFKQVAERASSGEGTLGKLLSEDDPLYDDLAETVAAVRDIVQRVQRGEGAAGRLLSDDRLYTEIEATITEIRATIDDFRETAPVSTFTSVFFGAL